MRLISFLAVSLCLLSVQGHAAQQKPVVPDPAKFPKCSVTLKQGVGWSPGTAPMPRTKIEVICGSTKIYQSAPAWFSISQDWNRVISYIKSMKAAGYSDDLEAPLAEKAILSPHGVDTIAVRGTTVSGNNLSVYISPNANYYLAATVHYQIWYFKK